MTISIRLANESDIETIFDIRTSVRENHLSRQQLAEMGITPETISEAMQATPCLWIAHEDGIAAGFSMVDMEEGSLFAAFVRPDFEGRGIGRLLVRTAEEALFSKHATIWLETGATTRASGFYTRMGWNRIEDLPGGDTRMTKTRA